MEVALFISAIFEPFKSSWGVMAIPQPHDGGFIMPLGWEDELTQRSIEFTEIELTPQDESQDLP